MLNIFQCPTIQPSNINNHSTTSSCLVGIQVPPQRRLEPRLQFVADLADAFEKKKYMGKSRGNHDKS
jgi:hypothetical protein